ncbi:MAG: hypothetical protein RLZZ628_46 [Bacteroidota bacterium]
MQSSNLMAKKNGAPKLSDAEQVNLYMNDLNHTLKAEIQLLRTIIKHSSPKIVERIKWNAPSYYYGQDIVTFGPMKLEKIMLVFHHPFVVAVQSPILTGDYVDRRLVYFQHEADILEQQTEIQRIINEIITKIDNLKTN